MSGSANPPSPPFASVIRLPLDFDPAPLLAEAQALADDDWVPHFNRAYYDGDWAAVPLRGPVGETHPIRQISPLPDVRDFVPTPYLERAPAIAAQLARFHVHPLSTRLMRLGPASHIRPHGDYNMAIADGQVRIHMPLSTGDHVRFLLDDRPIQMTAGQTWFLDFNLTHEVHNEGTTPRIHLVLDCEVNDWLLAQLRAGTPG